MTLDARKVAVVADFLKESFPGCRVYDREDWNRVAQFYRIIDDQSGKILHRIYVSREFFDDHSETEIVPVLRTRHLLANINSAGARSVIVRSQQTVTEEGT